jgi:hypothetical protein
MSKRSVAAAGRGSGESNVRRVPKESAAARALRRVRGLCLALPDATERISHGSPCFFVRDKTTFVMFMDDHHGDGRLALWCAAPPGAQEALIAADPERHFRPPYVGHRGWIGLRLDRGEDWEYVAAVVDDAYRSVAPRKLIELLSPSG